MRRPKDSEPDDRDLTPNEYIHYIQEHGKECDRIEPELNKIFLNNTLKRASETKSLFQNSSKFILDNSSQMNNKPLNDDRSMGTMRKNYSYNPKQNPMIPTKELKRTPPKISNRNFVNYNQNLNYNNINNNNNSFNDRQYSKPFKITNKDLLNVTNRQSPLLRHQNEPNINQHNYIKTEPNRTEAFQREIKAKNSPPINTEYKDIYVNNDNKRYTQNPNTRNNFNKNIISKSMDFNELETLNNNKISEQFDMRPYYTEQGMKIYPGNYQGMTFKRPINENLYDIKYPPNIDNREEIRKDYHTQSAISQTIPDYILFDNLNEKHNTLRPYYFYDDNNIQYRQYSPYRNDYDNSRFGDPTYNYYLNGHMRSDVSKDWRFPPNYYYQPNEDFIKAPRTNL